MKAFICISLMCCATVFAQQVAQISGSVTDQSGAVVPDVEVTVTQNDTGLKRTATSDSNGFYVIPDLPLGALQPAGDKDGIPDVCLGQASYSRLEQTLHMRRFRVELDNYTYMSNPDNANRVLATLSPHDGEPPTMPPGGPYWTAAQLDLFAEWQKNGYQP